MRLQRSLRLHDAHEDAIWTVAWVPGGPNLITGSVDENVKSWDASGREDQEPGHTYTGAAVAAGFCVGYTNCGFSGLPVSALVCDWNMPSFISRVPVIVSSTLMLKERASLNDQECSHCYGACGRLNLRSI
jgi:WD40 repeat protein